MSRAPVVFLAAVLVAARAAASASSFRYERTVTPGAPGPNRLAPDVALLSGARPVPVGGEGGLEDLRLFDAAGREIPYLVVRPERGSPSWHGGSIAPIPVTKAASGFELDLGEVAAVDRLRVSGIASPFLKRYRLEGSGDRVHWVTLEAEATMFDLPEEKLRRIETAFVPGEFRYLRITWDDRQSARVPQPASAAARMTRRPAPPAPELVVVASQRRASEPGKSRFRFHLPGTRLPIVAFELEVGAGHLLRPAEITEARLSGDVIAPVKLGAATLRRAEISGLAAADLRIPVEPPQEAEVDLSVDDGDNPPLVLSAVRVELSPLPWIYFESDDGGTLKARFGDSVLPAPRYDIEAMRRYVASRRLADARWDSRRDLSPAAGVETPASLASKGGPVEAATFSYHREIPPSPAGLTALSLDAAVLAHAGGVADVRIQDSAGRQIPYILEKRSEPLSVDLSSPVRLPSKPDSRVSRYRLELPYATLPDSRLVLSTSARVFEREVKVIPAAETRSARGEEQEESGETLARSLWRAADVDHPAASLVLEIPASGRAALEIDVDEGDNSPLPLEQPRLLLPAERLRFFRPAGERLTLLYGKRHEGPARYDIALLAPIVLGSPANEIAPGPEPRGAEEKASESPVDARIFWGALAGATLLLIALIARLVRHSEPA